MNNWKQTIILIFRLRLLLYFYHSVSPPSPNEDGAFSSTRDCDSINVIEMYRLSEPILCFMMLHLSLSSESHPWNRLNMKNVGIQLESGDGSHLGET